MIFNFIPITLTAKISVDDYINDQLKIINSINPEFIGIYDIIEEKSEKERIFPLRKYMNTFDFCKILLNYIPNDKIIVYRSVKIEDTYESYVTDIKNNQNNFKNIVVVGNSANFLINTNKLVELLKKETLINIGCVLIPERKNEMELVNKRISLGVSFFITQIILNPEFILPILDKIPTNIKVWCTIVPIPNEKTLKMIEWLRVDITNFDLKNYPNQIICYKNKLKNYCFESISKIDADQMIIFINRIIGV